MHRTSKENEEESDSDDEEDDEKSPDLTFACVKHLGCVNRIRATQYENSTLAATWSELGHVNIWNITQQLQAVENPAMLERFNKDNINDTIKPIYTFSGHQLEGFALDWCQTQSGVIIALFFIITFSIYS